MSEDAGPASASIRKPRVRRARSVLETLESIVLGFEVVVVFLGALVLFGLHALPPVVAFTGGGVLIVVMLLAFAVLRFRLVGIVIGSLVQLAVIASGFALAALFIVGGIFAALWVYCVIMGLRLDRQAAARLVATEPAQTD